jgi:hypothetical protein
MLLDFRQDCVRFKAVGMTREQVREWRDKRFSELDHLIEQEPPQRRRRTYLTDSGRRLVLQLNAHYNKNRCFICGGGWCKHREPEVDLAKREAERRASQCKA